VKGFEAQMAETVEAVTEVNRKYGRCRMMPFVGADPRRTDVADIVMAALEKDIFKGVKVYPVMGFTPDDRRLYPIYEYCMKNGIPITAHCEYGGIPGLVDDYHLAHPKYWDSVLQDFSDLKLNLAHNDRTGSSWQPVIADLIMRFPNVYTDVSYDTEMLYKPERYFKSIKRMLNTPKIRERVLYGTDWYMGRCFWTERSYLRWFTSYSRRIPWCRIRFTEEEITRITGKNPVSFLGIH
jgi:predicted TIM-barrel fold metal-dependent hydrolase